MRVIGIDPSLTATGIAYADGSTSTVTYEKTTTGDQRLAVIYELVQDATAVPFRAVSVDLAVVEDLPTHAHGAGKTGMAQGVVRLALISLSVPYILVTAATLKKLATGKGTASKSEMRMQLYKRFGLDIADDNQVDAWWLRAMGCAHYGDPVIDLPKTHLAALAAVKGWPT
jgi:Holliday junction resolvasome RuvABC endonuclease subunit